jgi:hypothetical protein
MKEGGSKQREEGGERRESPEEEKRSFPNRKNLPVSIVNER